MKDMKYDVFISYSCENKDVVLSIMATFRVK